MPGSDPEQVAEFGFYQVGMSAMLPGGAPVHGGTILTVFGMGFGEYAGSPVAKCKLGLQVTKVLATTSGPDQFLCKSLPSGMAETVEVTISLNGQNYDGPMDGSSLTLKYMRSPTWAR